jgi:hypothetical protein
MRDMMAFTLRLYHVRSFIGTPKPESGLSIEVRNHLFGMVADGLPLLYLHIPNEGVRGKTMKALLKAAGLVSGAADFLIVFRGVAHFVELKIRKSPNADPQKALSQPQRDFRDECGRLGIPYAVCCTIDEVKNQLTLWGIK